MRPGYPTVVLVFFAVTITVAVVGMGAARGLLAWDVRFAYLPAAEAVLDGDSPYPALHDPILEDQKGYVYTPQLLLALVPLTPLPKGVVAVSSLSASWRSCCSPCACSTFETFAATPQLCCGCPSD